MPSGTEHAGGFAKHLGGFVTGHFKKRRINRNDVGLGVGQNDRLLRAFEYARRKLDRFFRLPLRCQVNQRSDNGGAPVEKTGLAKNH